VIRTTDRIISNCLGNKTTTESRWARKQRLKVTLQSLFAFDLLLQMLKQSTSYEIEEAVVLSQLALTFPHERPKRVLRTVIAWARYAALFTYNSTRKVFHGLRPTPFQP
jgi:hypothetical protein